MRMDMKMTEQEIEDRCYEILVRISDYGSFKFYEDGDWCEILRLPDKGTIGSTMGISIKNAAFPFTKCFKITMKNICKYIFNSSFLGENPSVEECFMFFELFLDKDSLEKNGKRR